jgi:hypothetical protein
MKNQFILYFTLILFNCSLFSQEENEKHSILNDRFQFEVGTFIPSKNVIIRADGSSPNDRINFSETFGLNNNEITFFLYFNWRFSKKWNLSVESFNVGNANKNELKEDIDFGNITFKKGTNIRGGFGLNLYRIYVGRTFSSGSKHEFGAGLGVHALNTRAFVEGDVLTSEGDLNFERETVNALVPLPNLGAWYYFTPNTKWVFIARLDWFGITIGEYSGGLWDIATGIKYQLFKHIGVGFDYRYFIVNANVNKNSWNGEFSMKINGPLLVVHANF